MLKDLRETRGLTQAEVADRLGLRLRYYGQIERADRILRLDVLWRLRTVLAPRGQRRLPDRDFLALAEWGAREAEKLREERRRERQPLQVATRAAVHRAAS